MPLREWATETKTTEATERRIKKNVGKREAKKEMKLNSLSSQIRINKKSKPIWQQQR